MILFSSILIMYFFLFNRTSADVSRFSSRDTSTRHGMQQVFHVLLQLHLLTRIFSILAEACGRNYPIPEFTFRLARLSEWLVSKLSVLNAQTNELFLLITSNVDVKSPLVEPNITPSACKLPTYLFPSIYSKQKMFSTLSFLVKQI